jgi:hypothetical protein
VISGGKGDFGDMKLFLCVSMENGNRRKILENWGIIKGKTNNG